ncbi:MAG: hypothetical protein Q7T31_12370 [Dietzia sp.]|uniref:Uncharacterized protein n=1 Tax=Dietzia cercidiphylli TaxID=498199 RepID=A0ABN2J6A5_9ACTN|nr:MULTISPECIES: hypothetical protein [unclassified Dietzia]MBC7274163.1 hypothetical protein [Streptomyces sp.]MBB1040439.1 hypothetical protein [Dietzia sp. Cai40]MBB1043048.1 hypothetical protein [Dietzia sp. DQ11-44]MBB1049985.1 hypothetical protein [Dietzia sp. CW19]MBB1053139.1 hypothetical protein [Dietzia sp. B44]
MKVVIYASARRHGITDAEIRAVLEHPIVRYRLAPRTGPQAKLLRMVGDPDGGALIEVVVDRVGGEELHVFHAMLLTAAVAREVLEATGGNLDLSDGVSRSQRTQREKR